MKFLFSELCDKEVINCATGSSVGYVCDLTISDDKGENGGRDMGRVCNLLVCPECGKLSFKKSEPICIPWEKVERIGRDFIIIGGGGPRAFGENSEFEERFEKEKRGFKTFFSKDV